MPKDNENDYSVYIVGPAESGKSALYNRLIGKPWPVPVPQYFPDKITQLHEVYLSDNTLPTKFYKLGTSEISTYYSSADLTLLLFNLWEDDEEIIAKMEPFILQSKLRLFLSKNKIIVVGTLVDIINPEPKVNMKRLQTLVKNLNTRFAMYQLELKPFKLVLVSSKRNTGIDELLHDIIPGALRGNSVVPVAEQATDNINYHQNPKRFLRTLSSHIKNHLWRYGLGAVLALIVAVVLAVPGIFSSGAIAISITGSIIGGVGLVLGACLFAFCLPMVIGYSLKWLGQGISMLANVFGDKTDCVLENGIGNQGTFSVKRFCFNSLSKCGRFISQGGCYCLGEPGMESDAFNRLLEPAPYTVPEQVNVKSGDQPSEIIKPGHSAERSGYGTTIKGFSASQTNPQQFLGANTSTI